MELNSIVVKESPGLCRCCLSEGCYKDLATEYPWMSETEVYADMLLECFDISITQNSEGPNGPKRLICEVCITRLRDACNFKKQVLNSEKKFVDMVARKHFQPKAMLVYEAHEPMKTEIDLEPMPGTSGDLEDVEYLEEDIEYVDDYREETIEDIQEQDITVSELEVKPKKSKKRSVEGKAEKKHKTQSTAINKYKADAPVSAAHERTVSGMRAHAQQVLLHSTATPFRWCSGRFKCIYCPKYFMEWPDFETHYGKDHDNIDLQKYIRMSIYNTKNICLNITAATCRVCNEPATDIDEFINHIIMKHDVKYDDLYKDAYICFDLSLDNICLICRRKYKSLNELYLHISKDHKSRLNLLCDFCGEAFSNKTRLDYHRRGVHQKLGFKCRICELVFDLHHQLTYHYSSVHKEKRFKCSQCKDVFYSSSQQKLHERVAHRLGCFKCKECGKEFSLKVKLSYHLKRHLKQKDVRCVICGQTFYERKQLNKHMFKHGPDRMLKCAVCDKHCPSQRALFLHEKTHVKSSGDKNVSNNSK